MRQITGKSKHHSSQRSWSSRSRAVMGGQRSISGSLNARGPIGLVASSGQRRQPTSLCSFMLYNTVVPAL